MQSKSLCQSCSVTGTDRAYFAEGYHEILESDFRVRFGTAIEAKKGCVRSRKGNGRKRGKNENGTERHDLQKERA